MLFTPSGILYSLISFPSLSINLIGIAIAEVTKDTMLLLQKSARLVTGIVMLVRLLQSENADPSILVTELGMVTFVRLLHPENAKKPILVTLLGMLMLVKRLQYWNA